MTFYTVLVTQNEVMTFIALIALLVLITMVVLLVQINTMKAIKGNKLQTSVPAVQVPQTVQQDDSELVAVITAAVASMLNTPPAGLRITSIKRVSNWNTAARKENNY